MGSATTHIRDRQLDAVAEALPRRASELARLFVQRSGSGLSRTEIGVLRTLSCTPQRITELAAIEGVTQPGITFVVNRLQERGLVRREPDPADRRAVLVYLTEAGAETFAGLRAAYRALLHEEMAALPDEDLDALARAVEILDGVVARLKAGPAGPGSGGAGPDQTENGA